LQQGGDRERTAGPTDVDQQVDVAQVGEPGQFVRRGIAQVPHRLHERPGGLLVAVEGLERTRLCGIGGSLPLRHERVQPGQPGGRVDDEVFNEAADVALVAPVEVGAHLGRY
jgi:hypothetical protein